MKLKRYLVQGFLLLLCSVQLMAGSLIVQEPQHPQDPQKPINKKTRIQPSSGKQETVRKSQTETGKKAVEDKKKKGSSRKGIESQKKVKKVSMSQRYIALKTNIAYDALALPNLAFEMQCSKHISVELPVICSFWDFNQKHALRTIAIQPEARWWLREAGAGHFFGVHANIGWFNAKWKDNRYQSTDRPLLGAGISYGYLLPLSAHWGAEFTLGAGYANMKYNTYYNIDNGAQIGTESRNYWGITRVGLSLSYRF